MLFVYHPKILNKHRLQFLLGVKMAPKVSANNAMQTKSIMECYGIFCGGQLFRPNLNSGYLISIFGKYREKESSNFCSFNTRYSVLAGFIFERNKQSTK